MFVYGARKWLLLGPICFQVESSHSRTLRPMLNGLVYIQAHTCVDSEVISRGVRGWDGDMCMSQRRIRLWTFYDSGSNQMEREFSVDHLGLRNRRS